MKLKRTLLLKERSLTSRLFFSFDRRFDFETSHIGHHLAVNYLKIELKIDH